MVVNIHAAKTQLSRLIARVCRGQDVVIARDGTPVARLVPIAPAPTKRCAGLLKNRLEVAADFDSPLPADVLEAFYRNARASDGRKG